MQNSLPLHPPPCPKNRKFVALSGETHGSAIAKCRTVGRV